MPLHLLHLGLLLPQILQQLTATASKLQQLLFDLPDIISYPRVLRCQMIELLLLVPQPSFQNGQVFGATHDFVFLVP